MSRRQSLESDTGVNYHSLAKRFPARLQTRSPPSAFRLPTRPSPQFHFIILKPDFLCTWVLDLISHLQKQQFEVKNVLMMDLFLTNKLFTSQDVNRWTWVVWITCALFWCFYHRFQLSFWRHPFTAKDLLVSKWWDAELLHWALEWVHFHFWMNYSFNGIIIQMYTRKLRKCGPQKVFVIIWIQIFALQTATWLPFTALRPWRGSQDQYMFTDYINCVWLAFYPSIVWNDIKHWLTYYKKTLGSTQVILYSIE